MSARTKKAAAPAGSLSDAPVGAAERSQQATALTVEVMRAIGAEQANLWASDVKELRDNSELAPWREDCLEQACESAAGMGNFAKLITAWITAFDGAVAAAVAPALTADEQRILTAYRTMDGRRQSEAMFYMEEIAKEFPGATPAATGGAVLDGAAASAGNVRAALDELRNHVGDESENLAILADTLRDLLWLATDALIKDGGERVDTLIRAAQRYVEDLDEIAKHLHKAEVAAKQGVAS